MQMLQKATANHFLTMFLVTLYLTRDLKMASIHTVAFCVIGYSVAWLLDLLWPTPAKIPATPVAVATA